MRKSVICIFLVAVTMLSLSVSAMDTRIRDIIPELSFTGTTANCTITVSDAGKDIDVTMKLLENGVTIKTWNKSGFDYVYMSKTATAQKGSTYKLIVTVSIDGETQPSAWVTKKCE